MIDLKLLEFQSQAKTLFVDKKEYEENKKIEGKGSF